MTSLNKHKILNTHHSKSGIIELILERKDVLFKPGDCMVISSNDAKSRPYSICSGINDNFLSFLIRRIENGQVSNYLSNLKKNDQLLISEPFGWFSPLKNNRNQKNILFATGTGIAPFLSYLKSYPNNPPDSLFYGVRKKDDLFGLNNFAMIKNLYISISKEESKYHNGRITENFSHIPLSKNNNYYCCGRESMINDVRIFLKTKGISKNKIFNEVFFNG